jgi:hypothetical protein
VAKKNARDNERRAIAEQLRKDQERKERRRSLLILGACVLVVVGLLTAALIPYLQQRSEAKKLEETPLSDLGVSTSAAECSPVAKKNATGSGDHINPPEKIDYPEAPPAFGPHWGNYLQGSEIRNFYSTEDRPEVERLVHSLEHGHTILWYDDTVKPDTKAYKDLKAMAEKIDADAYFMSAPWSSADGAAFPDGKHVALTHWTGPENQEGVTQYCGAPSGAVVEKFLEDYPPSDAPEPGAA